MEQSPESRWRVTRPERLLWAQWESDTSIFQGDTGETHLVSELPAEVLRELARSSMTQTELTGRLATLCNIDPSADWAEKIASILRDLADLELVEQTAS